jgi:Rps23 Pro-64 3,4-dihydroxylase Tpa1-like proline 4-hydroxylase
VLREELANAIVQRLQENQSLLRESWLNSGLISHCYLDDLLPKEIAAKIHAAYPNSNEMKLNKSLRELKYVAAQMDQYNPLLEEIIYAFQDSRVVKIISDITGLQALEPDTLLYAGGISMMGKGHFLNPHIDNSHNKNRDKYRVLNLLYYVSPNWGLEHGGNLEVWPNGLKSNPITIHSKFNRLAIMITNQSSWHSVSPVVGDGFRCCVSNYYFSKQPADQHEYFHVTSFRGRPNQFFRNIALKIDAAIRMGIRKLLPDGIKRTKHFYNKK